MNDRKQTETESDREKERETREETTLVFGQRKHQTGGLGGAAGNKEYPLTNRSA